jgi:hypothetical protein
MIPDRKPQNPCKTGMRGANQIRTGVSTFGVVLQGKDGSGRKRLQIRRAAGEVWDRFRFRVISERGGTCERCPATERLQLHHLSYERQGRELGSDVVVLCAPCHQAEHKRLRQRAAKAPVRTCPRCRCRLLANEQVCLPCFDAAVASRKEARR